MNLFFIVGEDSGDALAAPLIEALRTLSGNSVQCTGIGGPLMEAVGFETLVPMKDISVMGLWEVLPKIPALLKQKKNIIEEIERQNPDAVITVDFPDFNFQVAKALKKRGHYKGKIIHYVAPSVWAWRPSRAKSVAEFLDGMMCLFPMEPDYFKEHNLKAVHVGHPLVTSGAKQASGDQFREANGISKDTRTIGLFFGSRENEFKMVAPIIRDAAQMIAEVEENIHIISPTLPRLEYEVRNILKDMKLPVSVSANPLIKWEAMKACDIAIAVSGTVALELSYAEVPHLICYKVNPMTSAIIRSMAKTKRAHLLNILLDDDIIPECLQASCTVGTVAEKALALLNGEDEKKKQRDAFQKLDDQLHGADTTPPSHRAAQFIADILRS